MDGVAAPPDRVFLWEKVHGFSFGCLLRGTSKETRAVSWQLITWEWSSRERPKLETWICQVLGCSWSLDRVTMHSEIRRKRATSRTLRDAST